MAMYITIKAPAIHTRRSAAEAAGRCLANADIASIPREGDHTTIDIEGQVAWLTIGGKRHKCFINKHDGAVTDYRSGVRIVRAGIAYAMEQGIDYAEYKHISKRDRAQLALDAMVSQHGADDVWARIRKQEPLNP